LKINIHPKLTALVLLALLLLIGASTAEAQEEQPLYPVYIVQPGDNLLAVAGRFGVSLTDLANANGISNINIVNVGDELIIPGLSGIQGRLVTQKVDYGETYAA
jgi:LysM repeat protein